MSYQDEELLRMRQKAAEFKNSKFRKIQFRKNSSSLYMIQ